MAVHADVDTSEALQQPAVERTVPVTAAERDLIHDGGRVARESPAAMDEADAPPLDGHDARGRQGVAADVVVPPHRDHGGVLLQLLDDLHPGQITGVEDEVALRADPVHPGWKLLEELADMAVGDEANADGPRHQRRSTACR